MYWLCLFIALWQKKFNIADRAVEFLVKFLALFVKVYSGEDINNSDQNKFSEKVPSSLYLLRKTLSYNQQCFRKYVVCIKYHSLYYYENSTVSFAGQQFSKKCIFIKFPNHTSKHLRKECSQVLLKYFKSTSGKQLFMPFKTYCYRSIKELIQTPLTRSGWEQECEKWRDRNTDLGLLTDVYDGKICKTKKTDKQKLPSVFGKTKLWSHVKCGLVPVIYTS